MADEYWIVEMQTKDGGEWYPKAVYRYQIEAERDANYRRNHWNNLYRVRRFVAAEKGDE